METEGVVGALSNVYEGLADGGLLLDLQSVRPNPVVEVDGRPVCEIDGSPFFERADANLEALRELVKARLLVAEGSIGHDVLVRWGSGSELVDDWEPKQRQIPEELKPVLRGVAGECVVRERCLAARYRRPDRSQSPPGTS